MRVAIILKYSGPGHFDWLGQHTIYTNWLSSRNVKHEFVNSLPLWNDLPLVVLIDNAEDATAFKLRFGL